MKLRILKLAACLNLLAFSMSGLAMADDAQIFEMVKSMQKKMEDMQKTIYQQDQKISQLENRTPSITTAPAVHEPNIPPQMTNADFSDKLDNYMGGKDASKWLKGLKYGGDMRLRWESVNYAKGNPSHSGNENRARFRLRFGLEKKFNPDMKVGFRLASGQLTDPTSTNQTLTGNFNNKVIDIDRAYAIYTPNWAKVGPVSKLEIGGGKFANPFTRGSTDIIWDDDINPEGAYEMVDTKFIDTENLGVKAFATAGQLILRETAHNTSSAANSELFAFQVGLTPEFKAFDKPVQLLNAISFYNYSDYAHQSTFAAANSGASLAGGNPNVDGDATALDANQFKVIEIYNSAEFKPFASL